MVISRGPLVMFSFYIEGVIVKGSLLVVASIILLVGCKGGSSKEDESNSEMLDLIREKQSIWEDSGIRSYMFTYASRPSDCPTAEPGPPIVITVEDGQVSTVYTPVYGTFKSQTDGYPTMEDIFQDMINTVEEGPISIGKNPREREEPPAFDERFGFPTEYFYDMSQGECDAGSRAIRDFQ